MRWLLPVAVCLMLAGCSSGSSSTTGSNPPPPTGTPQPPIVAAMPGRRVWRADYTGPSLKCGKWISGDVPPLDTLPPDTDCQFGTENFGNGVTDPLTEVGPNALYKCDGLLHLSSKKDGWCVISHKTFSLAHPFAFRWRAMCTAMNAPGGWGGPVAYNGDGKPPAPPPEEQMKWIQDTGQWFGWYFSILNGKLVLALWGPSYVDEKDHIDAEYGVFYTFRADWNPTLRQWTFRVYNDAGYLLKEIVNSEAAPISRDRVVFENDPRVAIFLGDADLTFSETDAWSADPNEVEI